MNIDNLTIEQYEIFTELVEQSDIIGVFELFKIDISDMSIAEMNSKFKEITSLSYKDKPLKKYYIINGIKYKAQLNLTRIKAGQFIDFQSYMSGTRKLEQILSIFLIPMKKRYGFWREQKYGDYDMVKVQSDIKKHFTMSDAKVLSDFFLNLSVRLSQTLRDCLEKQKQRREKKLNRKIVG